MINVVCAVLEDFKGRLLVCQRPVGKALAGKWEFPGGKVEPDELPSESLRREILEELGCVVRVGQLLPAVEHHYSEFSIRLIPYRCTLEEGEPEALEHAELRWVNKAELAKLDWAEADVPIWQRLIKNRAD